MTSEIIFLFSDKHNKPKATQHINSRIRTNIQVFLVGAFSLQDFPYIGRKKEPGFRCVDKIDSTCFNTGTIVFLHDGTTFFNLWGPRVLQPAKGPLTVF